MRFLALSATLALAGCATPYQPSGFIGGFNEVQLSQSSYHIEFKGNAYTKPGSARDFAVLRGAELCLQSGYTHYQIVRIDDLTRTDIYTSSGGASHTTGNMDMFGNMHATTHHAPVKVGSYRKPGTAVEVQCLTGEGGISANDTILSLRAKHGITQP